MKDPVLIFASVCVTSVLRMTTLDVASKSTDQTYGTLLSTTWTTVEANTGIICACMPMLRGPLTWIFPRLFASNTNSANSSGHSWRFRRPSVSTYTTRAYTTRSRGPRLAATLAPPANFAPRSPTCSGWVHRPAPAEGKPPPQYRQREVSLASHGSQDPIILALPTDDQPIPMGTISKTTDVEVRFDDNHSL